MPRAIWSPLYLAAEPSLVSRSGLLGFFHDYLREAVREAYLPTTTHEQAVHRKLADYFDRQPFTPRKVDELPWQLAQAQAWQRLYDVLADLAFFQAAWKANQFEVKTYWAQVEGNTPLRTVEAYHPILNIPTRHPDYVWSVACLLDDTGHLVEALSLREYLVRLYRLTGDHANLQASLGNQANILYVRGDLDGAIVLLKEKEQICRELGNKDGLQASLGNQANILYVRGDLDGAMALLTAQEQICRELGNKDGLQRSFGVQAAILNVRGDLDGAMALLTAQEQICRELGIKDGLQRSFGNQANILYARGDLGGAMALYKAQERICRELGIKDGLAISLANRALILAQEIGRLREALPLAEEAYRLIIQHGLVAVARQIQPTLDFVTKGLAQGRPRRTR